MDVQAVHLQLLDLEVADDGPTDGQPADRQGTDGECAKGRGSDRGCPEAGRWPLDRSMDAGGGHGAPGPGVAAELIRRSMASSQVTGRAGSGWVLVRQGSGGMVSSVLGACWLGGRGEGTDEALVAGLQGQPVDDPEQQRLLAQQLGPLGRRSVGVWRG
jgi:hypothetical protein